MTLSRYRYVHAGISRPMFYALSYIFVRECLEKGVLYSTFVREKPVTGVDFCNQKKRKGQLEKLLDKHGCTWTPRDDDPTGGWL